MHYQRQRSLETVSVLPDKGVPRKGMLGARSADKSRQSVFTYREAHGSCTTRRDVLRLSTHLSHHAADLLARYPAHVVVSIRVFVLAAYRSDRRAGVSRIPQVVDFHGRVYGLLRCGTRNDEAGQQRGYASGYARL